MYGLDEEEAADSAKIKQKTNLNNIVGRFLFIFISFPAFVGYMQHCENKFEKKTQTHTHAEHIIIGSGGSGGSGSGRGDTREIYKIVSRSRHLCEL